MSSILKTAASVVAPTSLLLVFFGISGASSSIPPDTVLATVGNHKITERDVSQKLKDQINTLEAEVYQVREHAIDAIAADKLIQMGAENAHLSVDDFLKREVDDKIPNPSEAQTRGVYDAFRTQLHRPYEQEKPGIIAYLKASQKGAYREALVASLKQQFGVKVYLKAPRFYVPAGDHPSIGPRNAPVTIVEFGDFECPFTRKAEDILKKVRAKYGSRVRLVYVDHPLPIHKHAMTADRAARCADEQGKFWELHDAMFADQSKLEEKDLIATAARLKLDTPKFTACMDRSLYNDSLATDQAQAQSLRVEGTPTFYINGRVLFAPESEKDFDSMIDQELASGGRKMAQAAH